MTNEIKINLSKEDVRTAILNYVKDKYPTLVYDGIFVVYNNQNTYGYVTGKIKEG